MPDVVIKPEDRESSSFVKDVIKPEVVGGKVVFTGEGPVPEPVTPAADPEPVPETAVYVVPPSPDTNVSRREATKDTIGFAAVHQRAVTGNDITIRVEATSPITSIEAYLDNYELANERLTERPMVLERSYRQAGSASPGMKHALKLRATTEQGLFQAFVHEWEDSI